ncbi:MAG TPA: fasciclin domain-containing protein [Chitinophagaceae bacterium]|jgi:uncharacterized surface protein with fasciclin (FAS1) repeats|nr:fasciclin domain-containing protein [Chitinophagaceae bacterium]
MQNKTVYPPALVFLCYFLIACSNNASDRKNNITPEKSSDSIGVTIGSTSSKTIAENLTGDTSHTILIKALKSADLIETLTKPGPFTVFAPTNNAFRKLPTGILEAWMSKRKNDLVNILSYHIIAGLTKAKDMKDGEKLKTLAGEELIVTLRGDKLMINGNKVISDDIEAGNGIIYEIDDLLFPRKQNPGVY